MSNKDQAFLFFVEGCHSRTLNDVDDQLNHYIGNGFSLLLQHITHTCKAIGQAFGRPTYRNNVFKIHLVTLKYIENFEIPQKQILCFQLVLSFLLSTSRIPHTLNELVASGKKPVAPTKKSVASAIKSIPLSGIVCCINATGSQGRPLR
jgi:hypothetical protein